MFFEEIREFFDLHNRPSESIKNFNISVRLYFSVWNKNSNIFCRALYRFLRLQLQIKGYARKNLSLADIFRENVKKHPNKAAICFENQEWDFAKVIGFSTINIIFYRLWSISYDNWFTRSFWIYVCQKNRNNL